MKTTSIAVTLLASLSSAQTTWYVDVHAAAPGLGTQVSPYASIQYAHNQATTHNSDTILVAPGVYNERLTITKRVIVRSSDGPLSTALKPTVNGTVVRLNGILICVSCWVKVASAGFPTFFSAWTANMKSASKAAFP